MADLPTIETGRLILRPFTIDDAPEIQRLAGDPLIADTTLLIPHPYPDGVAEDWIVTHRPSFETGEGVVFAITAREDGTLLGAIGLSIEAAHERAEMGYWIGRPYWNRGYATEAAAAVLDYGFNVLRLNRIHAHHFARNPASGRVLASIGMKAEGTAPEHVKKGDRFEDLILYGLCRSDYDNRPRT
jgi:RimJ/RimL family protein N-acetyltransferase